MPTKTIHISGIQAGKSPNDVKRAFQGAGLQVTHHDCKILFSLKQPWLINLSVINLTATKGCGVSWCGSEEQEEAGPQGSSRHDARPSHVLLSWGLFLLKWEYFGCSNISRSLCLLRTEWWDWRNMATLLGWGFPSLRTQSLFWESNARKRRWSWSRETSGRPSHHLHRAATVAKKNSCFDLWLGG